MAKYKHQSNTNTTKDSNHAKICIHSSAAQLQWWTVKTAE